MCVCRVVVVCIAIIIRKKCCGPIGLGPARSSPARSSTNTKHTPQLREQKPARNRSQTRTRTHCPAPLTFSAFFATSKIVKILARLIHTHTHTQYIFSNIYISKTGQYVFFPTPFFFFFSFLPRHKVKLFFPSCSCCCCCYSVLFGFCCLFSRSGPVRLLVCFVGGRGRRQRAAESGRERLQPKNPQHI